MPRDPEVLATLSAILGIDERSLFEKAGVERPHGFEFETSPTVEQALASIAPDGEVAAESSPTVEEVLASLAPDEPTAIDEVPEAEPVDEEPAAEVDEEARAVTPARRSETRSRAQLRAVTRPMPRPVSEPAPVTTLRPVAVREASYIEDPAQRQFYQVRTLASVLGLVALAIAMLWAVANGMDALGQWWDDFFSGLRL